LKDLENALPSAASVHKMQVKDLLKELTDENQVKVEKIGSGNWYWCWAGEEARDKRNMVAQLQYVERDKTNYLPADIAGLGLRSRRSRSQVLLSMTGYKSCSRHNVTPRTTQPTKNI
jgi:metal-sulfur cluster biosynthetic enzyme